jgi:RND family efflux transporter MFP subunit
MISIIDGLKAEPIDGKLLGRRRRRLSFILILLAVVAVGATYRFFAKAPAPAAGAPLPVVAVAPPLQRNVTEWDDYVGRFAPSQTVEIRPRVSGAVTEIHFRDGDTVQKGQLLFTIDPRPFAASLAEARATVASARSTLALARSDLGRAGRLVGDEALSAGEVDALRARVQAAEAGLAEAEARVDARALDVEFTEVRSPIAGRISDRRVDIGNLVTGGNSGNATLLTTVNALDPIYFSFEGSEALYLKAKRQSRADMPPPMAEIRLQDETGYRWKGAIDFTDNGLNNRSGTIRGRAVLANPDYFLSPGMFGNMRLNAGGAVPALLVPDSAVLTDQARKIVLTVGADNKVSAVPVETGPVIDGLRVIRAGLSADAQVIIEGIPFASPGTEIRPHPGSFAPTQAPVRPVLTPASAQASFADR